MPSSHPTLVMCCTPINRTDYLAELRFAVLASEFFRLIYPQSRVFIGTTPDADIPEEYEQYFGVLRFPFAVAPFAVARQIFYREALKTLPSDAPIIFSGVDVLFNNCLERLVEEQDLVYSYRYHPAMPYCSDFFYVSSKGRKRGIEFQNDLLEIMSWQPKSIQDGWAEQISIAALIGHLDKIDFDGGYKVSPRCPEILLVPGDKYLYTPNDAFSSKFAEFTGGIVMDTEIKSDWERLFDSKISVHFKGNRKRQFFYFAALAYCNGRINPYRIKFSYPIEKLFDGFLAQRSKNAMAAEEFR